MNWMAGFQLSLQDLVLIRQLPDKMKNSFEIYPLSITIQQKNLLPFFQSINFLFSPTNFSITNH